MYSSELIKGTLKTIILNLLKERGRMYGYEITQTVKDMTAGKIQITEGALYPTLHALEADGLVTTESEFIGKRVRKYYTLSPSGKNKTKEKLTAAVELWCNNRDNAKARYGDIRNWDVSSVRDMSELFKDRWDFNDDIGGWDVSNVRDMSEMFHVAKEFNQPIGGWEGHVLECTCIQPTDWGLGRAQGYQHG